MIDGVNAKRNKEGENKRRKNNKWVRLGSQHYPMPEALTRAKQEPKNNNGRYRIQTTYKLSFIGCVHTPLFINALNLLSIVSHVMKTMITCRFFLQVLWGANMERIKFYICSVKKETSSASEQRCVSFSLLFRCGRCGSCGGHGRRCGG